MAFVNSDTKKKIDSIIANVSRYAVLVDDPKGNQEGFNFVPGLGMGTEAKAFRELSSDIGKGVFKMLVMGKFKNGKSTIINALIGKVIMARRATACTAVIATVAYGKDISSVRIVYTPESKKEPVVITIKQFMQDFMLTDEEEKCVEAGGQLNRFADVSHVELQSDDELFASGMKLTDSPGLEDRISCTNATNNYVSKANAIIFTLSATSLFSAKEREYISDNFAGKHMTNLFFIVNRINQLTSGQLESSVIPAVRNNLKNVFVTKDGLFDEELYKRRVFFVDAYGAECARIGEPYKIKIGKKEIEAPITLDETGMPEFEVELRSFLNSSERINATFSSTLTGMANTYQIAMQRVANDKKVRSLSAEERRRNAELAKQKFDEAKTKVDDIRKTVRDYSTMVAQQLYLDLLNLIQRDIPDDFGEYAQAEDVQSQFGMTDMVQLAANTMANGIPIAVIRNGLINFVGSPEKILKPFIDHINQYIREQIENWSKNRAPGIIRSVVEEMQQTLEEQAKDFDLSMAEAVNLFVYGKAKVPNSENSSTATAGLQSALAMYFLFDFGTAIGTTAEGGLSWPEFAKRVGIQFAADFALFIVLGPAFLVPAILARFLLMRYQAGSMGQKLLSEMGKQAFQQLNDEIRHNDQTFKNNIIEKFEKQGEKIAITALAILEDARNNQEKLLNENAKDKAAAEKENTRADCNLQEMHRLIDAVYYELYGVKPTEEEFANLAKKSARAH